MATRFTIQAVFQALDRMTAPIAKMRSSVRGLGNELERAEKKSSKASAQDPFAKRFDKASQAFGRIENRMRSVGTTALVAGTAAGFAFSNIVSSGSDLEFSLVSATSKLEDMSGRGSASYDKLRAAALQYGQSSMFSAQEVADSFNNLAQSGFDQNSMLAMMPRLIKFAVAGETDLAEASMMAGNAMGQFNMLYDKRGKLLDQDTLATNMSRVSDVLAKTANMSNASIQQIYESMTESGAIADISGVSLEKYAAMLGVLAQSGINATVAGTGLKNIFVRLKNPVSAGAKALSQYGIDMEKFTDIKDPMVQFQAMIGALEGASDKQKQGFLNDFFGKIPLASASVLFRGGAELVDTFYQGMLSSEGTTDIIADRLMATTKAKLAQTGGVFKGIGAEMFGAVQFPLEEALNGLAQWGRDNKAEIVDTFRQMALGARDFGVWLYENRDTLLAIGKAFLAMKAANMILGTAKDSFQLISFFAGGAHTATKLLLGTMLSQGTAAVAQMTLLQTTLATMGAMAIVIGITYLAKMVWDANEQVKDATGNIFNFSDLAAERDHIFKTEGRMASKEEVLERLKKKSDAFKTGTKDIKADADESISNRFLDNFSPKSGVNAMDDWGPQKGPASPYFNALPVTTNGETVAQTADGKPTNLVVSAKDAFRAVIDLRLPNGMTALTETDVPNLLIRPVNVPQTGGLD